MKFFLLFVLFITASVQVLAQTWEELNQQIQILNNRGEYEKALPLAEKALVESQKNPVGKEHPNYAISSFNLAKLYSEAGRYAEAEFLFNESKNLIARYLGDKSVDYAAVIKGLVELYLKTGEYNKAGPLILQAKEIHENISNENSSEYAFILDQLARFYSETGNDQQAEQLFIRAKDIRKQVLGEADRYYAFSLANLASFYMEIHQYKKAEIFYLQAEEITRKALGEDHPDYAILLNNMAVLHGKMGQFATADSLYLKVMEIQNKVLGLSNPAYAITLNNLGDFYREAGLYQQAESLLIQAEELDRKNIGESHPGYATTLNNLAFLYYEMGLNDKAEPYFIKANKIKRETLGIHNNAYAEGLDNLAGLYISLRQYDKATPLLIESREIIVQNIIQSFAILSEKEKGNLLKWGFENVAAKPNSILCYYSKHNPELLKNNVNQLLFYKGLTLDNTKNLMEAIRNEQDSATKKLFSDWLTGKAMLAKQYSLPIEKRINGLENIAVKTEGLEKELVRRSANFRNQQTSLHITLQDVQSKLITGEAAIEFINFELYNKDWTDSTIYAAYILRKNDSVPVFVPLCEEKQLTQFFSNSTSSSGSIKTLYRSDPVDEASTEVSLGDSLYLLIWKPLLPYLKGIKKISYSPSGLLNRIAFQALPTPDSQLLIDKYELNQYISTRQLAVEEEETKSKTKSITLFGDCAFTMDSISIVKNIPAKSGISNIYSAGISRDENKGSWRQLEGTATEINQIKNLFAKNRIDTVSYMQQKATEDQFKSLSGKSPTILHLATHGFFLPDPEQKKKEGFIESNKNTFKLSDDPMMRSGIVLSGANRVWSGQLPIEGREDGIVTAYEISQLDLRNTELVVLSACETALGDIKGTEGVFGLQRAFKLAGVKSLLLSLWKVPDKETAELMTAFYQYYLNGNSAREALHKAQLEMKKKYRPYYWAAFVLIE